MKFQVEAFIEAIQSRDLLTLGRMVEALRTSKSKLFPHGLNYDAVAALAEGLAGINAEDWEELMQAVDEAEGAQ
jgi:hypothetical protein